MVQIPYIPETAPFTAEQRAWLNGFLAGLFSQVPPGQAPAASPNGAPEKPGEPLLILFGSQTGTAEGIARRLAKEAQQRGFAPKVLALNDYSQADLTAGGKAIIISSTWGDGEPPDNAAEFWRWLTSEGAPRLDNLHFGVLGLGDRNYSDFCGASKKFDTRLAELGAHRLLPRGECDVEYEAIAKGWCEELWPVLGRTGASPVPPGASPGGMLITGPRASLIRGQGVSAGGAPAGTGEGACPTQIQLVNGYGKSNPYPAVVRANRLLNKPGSGKEVRHYEIALGESGLTYEVGDALGVVPENCPALVEECLAAAGCSGDESVEYGGQKVGLHELLHRVLDINRPSTDLLAAIAKAAPSCEFAPLLAAERALELKKWLFGRDVIDVLAFLPAKLPPQEMVGLLRKLAPRLYSICSSPKAHPGEVHLTVGTVRYESFGRRRKGVCSTFLADRGQTVPVFVQPSHGFKPPADLARPMIMVGPGTGIAPFRAFLEERQATGATGKNWLFFGDQSRQTDFLYEEQLTEWHKAGHLARLDLAFSRDQQEKIYVQHRMVENARELWRWLEEGAHFYVCGDASRMAKDVDEALHQVIQSGGHKSREEAQDYVAKLKSEKRYQRDVY